MPTLKYPKTNSTSKSGINYVRGIVEGHNSIFHDIHQENDVGIDAVIEIIKGEHPTAKLVAVQIKSGESFFVGGKCVIPIEHHREYWQHHTLPVIGIVYIPAQSCGYWVNIKDYLAKNKQAASIRFQPTITNTFDLISFSRIFVPYWLKESPQGFTYQEAKELLYSEHIDDINLGIVILFRSFTDKEETWKELVEFVKSHEVNDIPKRLMYYLAHIPGHPDIYWRVDIPAMTREAAQHLLNSFDKSDVVKLLSLIDNEGIIRGATGQSVEAIISSLSGSKALLESIWSDNSIDLNIRELAFLIYSFNFPKAAVAARKSIPVDSITIRLVKNQIKRYGGISLY